MTMFSIAASALQSETRETQAEFLARCKREQEEIDEQRRREDEQRRREDEQRETRNKQEFDMVMQSQLL
jgi:hypothetical protein